MNLSFDDWYDSLSAYTKSRRTRGEYRIVWEAALAAPAPKLSFEEQVEIAAKAMHDEVDCELARLCSGSDDAALAPSLLNHANWLELQGYPDTANDVRATAARLRASGSEQALPSREEIAKALCAAYVQRHRKFADAWEYEEIRDQCYDLADAVLALLPSQPTREPSDEEIKEAIRKHWTYARGDSWEPTIEEIRALFRAPSKVKPCRFGDSEEYCREFHAADRLTPREIEVHSTELSLRDLAAVWRMCTALCHPVEDDRRVAHSDMCMARNECATALEFALSESGAVTPLTDGIDGTPYVYAVKIDRYEAANTLAAVLAYPDSGDWHAQMRSKLAMVARGYEPNKIWGTEPAQVTEEMVDRATDAYEAKMDELRITKVEPIERVVLMRAALEAALFRAPDMMPESKWYISERAKEAADKAFGAPSEVKPCPYPTHSDHVCEKS